MIRLFSSRTRERKSRRKYSEPMYAFLNASAWPSVQRVRDFWEGWFAEYDKNKQKDVAARFRSYDYHPHLSAFLELFTFAVLRQAGHEVDVEPAAGPYRLEFLASPRPTGEPFDVECTTTGQRAEEARADVREAAILDVIDRLPTGHFLLGVDFRERGAQTPSTDELRRGLASWLSSLEEASLTTEDHPEWIWSETGWTIRFFLLSKLDEADDEGAGVGMIGPVVSDRVEHLRIRSAVDRKASKYGSLGAPLLIVINSTEYQMDHDLTTALGGDKIWQMNMNTREFSVIRKPNGVFFDSTGPRNVNLSALIHGYFGVLSFVKPSKPLVLVHHPYASHPLPRGLFKFCEERYFTDEGEPVTVSPTQTMHEFFGLPPDWPFFDQDPDDEE